MDGSEPLGMPNEPLGKPNERFGTIGIERYRSPWRTLRHDALAGRVRGFLATDVRPYRERFRSQGYPDRDVYRRAGQLGLLGLSVAAQYGGGGGGFGDEAVLVEEQVLSGDEALGFGVHCGIAPRYVVAYGTPEQRERWLPGICTGELVATIAITHLGEGADLPAISAVAVRSGPDYLISGRTTYVANGPVADLVLLAVRTDPDPTQRAGGICLLVCEVRDGTAGVARARVYEVGLHGGDAAELRFDQMRVPAANLLGGQEGLGLVQLMQQLPAERLVIGVAAVAAMERAILLSTGYTYQRIAGGRPLITLPDTRSALAECAALARVGRTFLDDCIQRHQRGQLDVATSAMAKYWLTRQQCEVVEKCLRLFDRHGYPIDDMIARLHADTRMRGLRPGPGEGFARMVAPAV